MQNRLTIKDIARLSGVGKSTVSRVLNNESGVSQRTRERVEAVMNPRLLPFPFGTCHARPER
jgi:transcriptional regulator, LacI family